MRSESGRRRGRKGGKERGKGKGRVGGAKGKRREWKKEVACKQINTRRGRKRFGRFCEGGAAKGGAMQVVYTCEYCLCSENVDTFGCSEHRSWYIQRSYKATKDDLDSEKNSSVTGKTFPTFQRRYCKREGGAAGGGDDHYDEEDEEEKEGGRQRTVIGVWNQRLSR